MLELNKISLSRGKKILLEQASVRIGSGYRVGLVGRNGAGKSSLIKMLLGEIPEDAGSINLMVDIQDIAYLEQSLPSTQLSAIEYAQGGDKAWFAVNEELRQAEAENDGLLIADCHARLQQIDGYSIEARAAKILLGLGFENDEIHKSVDSFSGGWQMRLQLARVLLSRSYFLLLDEPTNHLDINAIVWLENWLSKTNSTVVLISHDRDFLDNVCNYTVHLSHAKLKLYQGNYTAFSKQYNLQLEVEARQREKIEVQRAHMQSFVDRFRAKASKAKQAQGRVKALEKLVLAPGLQRENPFHFEFLPCQDVKGSVINFDGSAGYGKQIILQQCRLNVDYGDRIGLIGKNGQGKTTLLKTLAKELDLVDGKLHLHSKVKLAYFSQQQQDMLDKHSTPMQSLLSIDKKLSESAARRFLGGFDFSGERVFERVESFSGGEKARLALAILIYQSPNLLLLDEPTNHLDMQMREAFILALQNFTGSVVLVSHDRYFMSSVVNEVWCVADSRVQRFSGDLDDYKRMLLSSEMSDSASVKKNTKPKADPVKSKSDSAPKLTKRKIDYKALKRLEARMEKATELIASLELKLADEDLYSQENKEQLHDVVVQHKEAKDKLAVFEQQWMEMQE